MALTTSQKADLLSRVEAHAALIRSIPVEAPPVTVGSVTSVTAAEGVAHVHYVALSAQTTAPVTFPLTLGGGTASAGIDYTSTLTNTNFNSGVTFANGVITVPAGVLNFTVSVSTTDDTAVESTETYVLTVGGVNGTGTITDNDVAAPPPPAPAPATAPPAPTPIGTQLYFAANGSNGNPGTQASPKLSVAGVSGGLNSLPAGSALYFRRGDTFAWPTAFLNNPNATTANPVQLRTYGTGAKPILSVAANNNAFVFNLYSTDTVQHGGYRLMDLDIRGPGTGSGWGLFFIGACRDVTLDNCDISGFELGIHTQQKSNGTGNNVRFAIYGGSIHHNHGMGLLGDAVGIIIRGVNFQANNQGSGSALNHAIYFGGNGANAQVLDNTFRDNSVVNGVAMGGTLTVHGIWDNVLIQNNLFTVPASQDSNYGVSITDGYTSAEAFTNVVVRGNQFSNLGAAIVSRGAPGIIVEDNVIRPYTNMTGIAIDYPNGGDDNQGLNPIVRNNTICRATPGGTDVRVSVGGAVVTNNVTRSGSNASSGVCAFTA